MQKYIKNAELLIQKFGYFPIFHDAEVIEISLKRRFEGKLCPTLSTLIQITNYKTKESFLVELLFKSIFGLRLENFNHQNVLNDLLISEFSQEFFDKIKTDERLMGVVGKRELENLNYYVKFEYDFGIEAEFLCGEIILESVRKI
jgi:Immunity protein 50